MSDKNVKTSTECLIEMCFLMFLQYPPFQYNLPPLPQYFTLFSRKTLFPELKHYMFKENEVVYKVKLKQGNFVKV